VDGGGCGHELQIVASGATLVLTAAIGQGVRWSLLEFAGVPGSSWKFMFVDGRGCSQELQIIASGGTLVLTAAIGQEVC